MFLRAARYYLRSEWLRLGAAVLAAAVIVVLLGNSMKAAPLTYESFMSQYSRNGRNTISMDELAKWSGVPREELGESLEEAFPAIREHRLVYYLSVAAGSGIYFFPLLAGAAAVLFLCILFRKRRLGPLFAAGCPRRAVYLFSLCLFLAFFLLCWFLLVPCCFSRYRSVPLDAGQRTCMEWIGLTVLFSLLFCAAVSFFFAFLLRRPFPVLAAVVGLCALLTLLGAPVPVPVSFVAALLEWNAASPAPLILQGCVAGAALLAAAVGGWLCFRRWELK